MDHWRTQISIQKINLNINENENTVTPILRMATKAIIRGKFTVTKSHHRRPENSQVNSLLLLLLLSRVSSTLCDPIDSSPPGSPIPGILHARALEWAAIFFSNAWKWKVKVNSLSHVWLSETPWAAAYQAPPSMGFSRQEYWSGVPLPSPS